MTPLLTALSSLRDADCSAALALAGSPVSAASRKERTAVLSEDLTPLLRRRAASFVRIRLIWDLMFATEQPRSQVKVRRIGAGVRRSRAPPGRAEGTHNAGPKGSSGARTRPNRSGEALAQPREDDVTLGALERPQGGQPGVGRLASCLDEVRRKPDQKGRHRLW